MTHSLLATARRLAGAATLCAGVPLVAALAPGAAAAQQPVPHATSTDDSGTRRVVTPRPEDVASADAITAALYDVISGPAGRTRDWDRFRSLFIPEAHLIVSRARRDSAGQVHYLVMAPERYIATSDWMVQRGFFEREIAHTSETFGRVTHRFSTYESRGKAEDPKPIARGINSIQLLHDGARWWVVNVCWDSEGPNNPIPEKDLPR